ncbi:hypothetical protein KL86APRO_20267 [uncultured Alphaproteobacteria bacterium]|uniref:HTH marR-type domain-containing protein n=1 Tax=uncultured Alphaproteobacteria bacterium TaxID=91750 RepID=A0A212KJ51_9PROT|nr:hypothetical protein KL86APRO_20267 [uncultured Alphaproteobacteria bacterium]
MLQDAQDFLALWKDLINRVVFLEKRYVFCYEDLRLHPSELHVLLAIHNEPEANATRLAARLGVTKGAVSQALKRLEGKGVIIKSVDPSQKNEVTVLFTTVGRRAVESFLTQRSVARQRFHKHLSSLSETEKETLRRFLEEATSFLPLGK